MKDILKLYFDELKPFKSTNEENLILYHKWKAGDMQAYDKLVRCFLPLVIKICKRYKSSSCSLEDLIGEGNMYLCIALSKFEESKGTLAAYIAMYVEGVIIRFLKKENGVVHIPENVINTKSFDVSYYYLDQEKDKEDGKSFELEDKVTEDVCYLQVYNFLNTLDERDRKIIELAFSIGYEKQHNANEIAKILDISSVTVRNRFKDITNMTIGEILVIEPNFEAIDNHAKTIQSWLDEHLEHQDKVTYEVVSRGTNLHLSIIKKSVTENQKLRIKNHNKQLNSLKQSSCE